jgi:UDP-glucose 4-epimerase
MSILITGVAGFIGSNLARQLLVEGKRVYGIDNYCRGTKQNVKDLLDNPLFALAEFDLCDLEAYQKFLNSFASEFNIEEVWHLAANSDIPAGIENANVDLRDTFLTTFNTLEVMRKHHIPVLAFSSTSAIYGDLGDKPLTEDIGPLFPISNYGAMKLASEALISAAVESWLKQAYIFRFPNVIGTPATHGVIMDFIRKLQETPKNLQVLGDGSQKKSYLHVKDLIDAMSKVRSSSHDRLNYFNIGAGDSGISVHDIANIVVQEVSPNATITFGKGDKGWVGDVSRFTYSIEKLKGLGWRPSMDSTQAVRLATCQIAKELADS